VLYYAFSFFSLTLSKCAKFIGMMTFWIIIFVHKLVVFSSSFFFSQSVQCCFFLPLFSVYRSNDTHLNFFSNIVFFFFWRDGRKSKTIETPFSTAGRSCCCTADFFFASIRTWLSATSLASPPPPQIRFLFVVTASMCILKQQIWLFFFEKFNPFFSRTYLLSLVIELLYIKFKRSVH